MRIATFYVNAKHMGKLKVLAEAQGLKTSQLVRVAIAEYLRRNPLPEE